MLCCTFRQMLLGLILVSTPAGLLWPSLAVSQEKAEGRTTTILEVGGMSSPLCQLAIETTLAGMEGVGSVAVDRDKGEVRASHDPDKAPASAIASAIRSLGFSAQVAGSTSRPVDPRAEPTLGCSLPVCTSRLAEQTGLPEAKISNVIDFVTGYVMESESIPSATEVHEATGVTLSAEAVPGLQRAVLAKLLADPEGRRFAAMSRCTAYSACSVHRNLLNASADELEMYRREKEEDGRVFDDFTLPRFEARDLDGDPVSSADLQGQRVLLVFLALHCHHSIETLPILANLQAANPETKIVGVIVNSGSAADVDAVLPYYWEGFDRQFEVWVSEDPALGDVVDSHLVPGFFFIDSNGGVQQKLVGQKTEAQLTDALQGRAPSVAETAFFRFREVEFGLPTECRLTDGLSCSLADGVSDLWEAGCDLLGCLAGY